MKKTKILVLTVLVVAFFFGGKLLSGNAVKVTEGEKPKVFTSADKEIESMEQTGEDAGKEDSYKEIFEKLADCYAFNQLDEARRHWYADIYTVLSGHLEEGDLLQSQIGTLNPEDIDAIFQCVMNDHPELFYVEGYQQLQHTRNEETVRIVFRGMYSMDAQEARIRAEQIELYVDKCLQGISSDASDYEKVKYVYDYIIENTQYLLEAPQNQNICSVFIGQKSVCQGYAKAMQFLLERLEVPCTVVLGTVEDGVGHAWNLVQVDGEYYYVDPTWGDASYRTGEGMEPADGPSVNYDYLCVTTEQICRTHVIDNVVPMPLCTATAANYYVVEGGYFPAYDEEQVAAYLEKIQSSGQDTVTVKCADKATYDEFYKELITNQSIFRFWDVEDGILAYTDNKEQLSITFWLLEE